jgi:MFS family permease
MARLSYNIRSNSNDDRLLNGLLISTLDTSIVSTSLVTISNDLGDFVNAPWIILAYLLTYMGSNHAIRPREIVHSNKVY